MEVCMAISRIVIPDKKSLPISRYLFVMLLRLKTAIYRNNPEIVSAVGVSTDADDWIIGGQSLAAHCKRMRYVEKNEPESVAKTESGASGQTTQTNGRRCKDLLETAVL
jgi:hypothetical protein